MFTFTHAVAQRPLTRRWLLAAAGWRSALPPLAGPGPGDHQGGISSFTFRHMAISETTLKDVMLMLIDEQNKKGGLAR